MPATIKDIAVRLGVSHSTVSRALRGFPYVNETLRQRVQEIARELNYRPNALARGLKGMRTQVVGLIIPDLMNDYYASAATTIQATLAAEGYRLLLAVSGNDPCSEQDYLRAMREERVEGLIWVPCLREEHAIREYEAEGVPVVEFTRRASRGLDAILPDDLEGAQQGTQHLLTLGHRRIAVIVGQKELSSARGRLEGYRRTLRAAGLEVDRSLIMVGRFDRRWGRQATEELLDLPIRPTAIFAMSSELVIGALHALDRRGLRVPEEISFVGFGNPDWYGIWRPPITAVAFPVEDMATMAVQTLLRRVRGRLEDPRPKPTVSRLPCRLVVRGSTAPPATG